MLLWCWFCACFQRNDSGTSLGPTLLWEVLVGGTRALMDVLLLGGTFPGRTWQLRVLRWSVGRDRRLEGLALQRQLSLLPQEGRSGLSCSPSLRLCLCVLSLLFHLRSLLQPFLWSLQLREFPVAQPAPGRVSGWRWCVPLGLP